MLSNSAVEYLSPMTYQDGAKRYYCQIPLGGIYWDDEIPDFEALQKLDEEDYHAILILFGIRYKLWSAKQLTDQEEQYWEAAKSQVPKHPLFHRLDLSVEDRKAQDEVETCVISWMEELSNCADKFELEENEYGSPTFSATFDLTKGKLGKRGGKSWWSRLKWSGKK